MTETKPKPKWEKWVKRFFIGTCCFIIVACVVIYLFPPPHPNPEIMKLEARETRKHDCLVVILDVSIENFGAKGDIKIVAEVDVYLEGYYGKQDKTIFLDKGESKDLQFVFETKVIVKETLIWGEPIYPAYTYGIELEY